VFSRLGAIATATCFLLIIGYFTYAFLQSGSEQNNRKAKIYEVVGCDNPDPTVDIVFIHGVDGDYKSTWHPANHEEAYWPRWLGEELPGAAVWSIDYPAATKVNGDGTMALQTRADNLLSLLDSKNFDDRPQSVPVIFVMHSFGGVVAKQMIRNALDSPRKEWQSIGGRVKGAVFIAVPNAGAEIASFFDYVAPRFSTVTIENLRKDEPNLLNLNRWFRDNARKHGIKTMAFFETRKTSGIHVVPESSADPNIEGTSVVGLDDDHISICKLQSPDSQLFDLTKEFVAKRLRRPGPPTSFPVPADDDSISKIEHDETTPAANPTTVMLTLKNNTNLNLEVVLFDWSRFYREPDYEEGTPVSDAKTWCWKEFIVDSGKEVVFEDFTSGKGWFSVFVRLPEGGYSPCLRTLNIFANNTPVISVKKVNNEFRATKTN